MTDWNQKLHGPTFPGIETPTITPDQALEWMSGDCRIVIIANWHDEEQRLSADLSVGFASGRVPKAIPEYIEMVLEATLHNVRDRGMDRIEEDGDEIDEE